jgi:hypothetical protein
MLIAYRVMRILSSVRSGMFQMPNIPLLTELDQIDDKTINVSLLPQLSNGVRLRRSHVMNYEE